MNGQSEGDYLNERADDFEVEDHYREKREDRRESERVGIIRAMQKRYTLAENADIGDSIQCAACGRMIVKTTYHKRFCSNGKTRTGGNCKDRYWNTISTTRRKRAEAWNR